MSFAGPALAARDPLPFGALHCHPRQGVRFCAGNGTTTRIPSWDGVPLDVDVTLPGQSDGNGPWPTIVMLHGWGGNKTEMEWPGNGSAEAVYNNVFYARHGFAVVTYTARGLGKSCGGGGIPHAWLQVSGRCAHGFSRFADQRYEARDTQYLLGLLVDERIADPRALGVTGWSYGGGESIELAYLHNRIRCAGSYDTFARDPCRGKPEDAYVPWRSPRGTPLQIAAAYVRYGFSDLPSALVPNGRLLDYDPATDGLDGSSGTGSPVGVPMTSVDSFLYGYGAVKGYYERPAPFGDPAWDLTTDLADVSTGNVLGSAIQAIVDEWAAHHQGFGIPGRPAPLLLEYAWDDFLFPPTQGLRIYNDVRSRYPRAFVALQLGSIGHPLAAYKRGNEWADDYQALAFFEAKLMRRRGGPRAGSVTAFTQTCPSAGPEAPPEGGPYRAPSWPALHPGIVVLASRHAQQI
jgi:dienelactone hydrolase